MTNSSRNNLLPIPVKRYFSLEELCELVQISPAQFAQWQHEHGVVVGHGGNSYTRGDVVKLRKLKDTFAPFIDEFNHNALDFQGRPAAKADEIAAGLKLVLDKIEKVLAK